MILSTFLVGRTSLPGTGSGRAYHDRDEGYAFTTGIRFNREIDFLEVLSFWAEGVGAATFLAAIVANSLFLAICGLVLVGIAILALVAHLGKAGRSWRVTANIATAWVSRGPVIIGGFIGSGLAWLYLGYVNVLGPYRPLAYFVSFAFAVLLMLYGGFLLRSIKAVKLWNGVLLPTAFVSHSVTSGIIVLAGMNWAVADGPAFNLPLVQLALASLVLSFVFTVLHLRRSADSLAINASLARLVHGKLKFIFLGAALVLGLLVPFLLILAYAWWHDSIAWELAASMALVAVVCRLAGDFAYRYAVVRAGAYQPII